MNKDHTARLKNITANYRLAKLALNSVIREAKRLRKYEALVHYIANDYYELSHDKVKWQRDDWYKSCKKLIERDSNE